MTKFQKVSLVSLRLVMGWMFFYAGITKILDPNFSAAGYLKGAKTFAGFYNIFLNPQILPVINFLNEWGIFLVGVSLLLGVLTRFSSFVGAGLLLLYYFPILGYLPQGMVTVLSGIFPFNLPLYPDTHSFIVDSHIIEVAVLMVVGSFKAGRVFGLENWCSNLPICRKLYAKWSWLG